MGKLAKPKETAIVKHSGTMELGVTQDLARGTNIMDIVVPPELERYVPSGIAYFDKIIGGGEGSTPSSSILLSGGPGCGKTTMCLQLLDALTAKGCICLYNTNEEAAVQVRKTTKRLNLKNGFIIGQDRLVPKALEHMKWLVSRPENKGKQQVLVCDSLQTMDDGYYANGGTNSNTPVRVTQQLIEWCKATFGIAILIGQVDKSGEFLGKKMIQHAVDVHLHLYIDVAKKSETYGERIFDCRKNRYSASGRQFVVGMDKHRGLYEKMELGLGMDEGPPALEAVE